ncbi:DUF4253 domain-containing protein [Dictyobacter aurantiacus]|nr:DUF4253 domain-containing protein [Dictyobacter aurantiacus]
MNLEETLQYHHIDVSSLSLPEYQRGGKEHPICLLRVPVTQILAQWEVLRGLVSETGYWPVIGWDRFKQPLWEEEMVQTILEAGLYIDIQQWLKQEGIHTRIDEEGVRKRADVPPAPFDFRLPYGRFPYTLPSLVPIALVPTTHFWEVPAYLPVQGNEWDPSNAVQVAMMKYWNERWGAELVAMAPSTVEMRVLQPPTTWEDAFLLAKEQYIYAPDVVDQWLRGNFATLVKTLLNGHVWLFWWD